MNPGQNIGTEYETKSYLYCEDDNTYTPICIFRKALACHWIPPQPQKPLGDLFLEMFS